MQGAFLMRKNGMKKSKSIKKMKNCIYRKPTAVHVSYKIDKFMLPEQTDGFYIFGKHMGVGENRSDSRWVEIESTYWMEKILHNIR